MPGREAEQLLILASFYLPVPDLYFILIFTLSFTYSLRSSAFSFLRTSSNLSFLAICLIAYSLFIACSLVSNSSK